MRALARQNENVGHEQSRTRTHSPTREPAVEPRRCTRRQGRYLLHSISVRPVGVAAVEIRSLRVVRHRPLLKPGHVILLRPFVQLPVET